MIRKIAALATLLFLFTAHAFAGSGTTAPPVLVVGKNGIICNNNTCGQNFPVQTVKTVSSYPVVATDASSTIPFNNTSASSVTIAQSTSSFFPTSTPVCFTEENTGGLTITATGFDDPRYGRQR